jgi:hypothetical protein
MNPSTLSTLSLSRMNPLTLSTFSLLCCALAPREFVLTRCPRVTPDAIVAAHAKQPALSERKHTAMETVSRIYFDLLLYLADLSEVAQSCWG